MENEYIIRRQRYDDVGRSFTCGDVDLDDFFKNDSLHYTSQKLASTYVVEDTDGLLAYFSLANDRISVTTLTILQPSTSFGKGLSIASGFEGILL